MVQADSNFTADDSDDLAIRGELETSSVPELLRSILNSNETGILTFRNSEVTKSLYIQTGRVVYAGSTDPDERLGENLLLRGRITARQYIEASKQIRPGRRLGAILVELGGLDPEELIPAVEQQVKDILMDLFSWTRGDYEFLIKEMDPDQLMVLNMSTENLLLEGIRRSRAWSRILRGIGSIEAVPCLTGNTDVLYKLELTDEEQEVLSHVNGRSNVEQICSVSYLSNLETCRVLWALALVGVLRWGQVSEANVQSQNKEREREMDLEDVVERFNQMFGRIYGFLRGRVGDEVDEFMEGCLDEVSRQYGTMFAGVDMRSYGRADFDQMLANVADLPADQRRNLMVTGLNELLYVIQLAVRTRFGIQEEAVISGIVKDGLRRMSAL